MDSFSDTLGGLVRTKHNYRWSEHLPNTLQSLDNRELGASISCCTCEWAMASHKMKNLLNSLLWADVVAKEIQLGFNSRFLIALGDPVILDKVEVCL